MAKSVLLTFALLILRLGAANLLAQDLQMVPPPLPSSPLIPPPAPNAVPAPPQFEWEPIGPLPQLDPPIDLPQVSIIPPGVADPAMPLSAPPPVAPFIGGAPNPIDQWRATPRFEIWRSGAETPEIPVPAKEGWQRTLITNGVPVVVRLLFDPSMTGNPVTITISEGVLIQPAQEVVNIGAGGECLFTVDLDSRQEEGGEITFYTKQVTTGLLLAVASPEMIELMANQEGGQ